MKKRMVALACVISLLIGSVGGVLYRCDCEATTTEQVEVTKQLNIEKDDISGMPGTDYIGKPLSEIGESLEISVPKNKVTVKEVCQITLPDSLTLSKVVEGNLGSSLYEFTDKTGNLIVSLRDDNADGVLDTYFFKYKNGDTQVVLIDEDGGGDGSIGGDMIAENLHCITPWIAE